MEEPQNNPKTCRNWTMSQFFCNSGTCSTFCRSSPALLDETILGLWIKYTHIKTRNWIPGIKNRCLYHTVNEDRLDLKLFLYVCFNLFVLSDLKTKLFTIPLEEIKNQHQFNIFSTLSDCWTTSFNYCRRQEHMLQPTLLTQLIT